MKKLVVIGLAAMMFASCSTMQQTQQGMPRKDVDGVEGKLSLHPVFTDLQTKNQQFFFFLDFKQKTLFMTEDTAMYMSFSGYLPEIIVPGRYIKLEGSFIDPFTLFTKEEFDQLNSKMATLGVQLNTYKVARIFNYGFNTGVEVEQYTPSPKFAPAAGEEKKKFTPPPVNKPKVGGLKVQDNYSIPKSNNYN
jgi:hypothetical protein